jgi:hypothetical protein
MGRTSTQSHSPTDFLSMVRQCVTAGQQLLKVVETIWSHDNQSAKALDAARDPMYDRINQLVIIAREVITLSRIEDEDMVIQEHGHLHMAAASCIRAAGECVVKPKFVVERVRGRG